MVYVYVLSKSGKPLAPTVRCGHVRILLKEKKARVVCGRPFTVQLLYDTDDILPYLYGGTDPGRTNIGNAVVTPDGECVYRDKVQTRNKNVTSGMTDRKTHRKARKRGRRLRRKRRAKKNGTLSTKLESGRLIPGTKKPTPVKDIINKESRFRNRKKKQLINPSVKQLVETHLNHVDQIRKFLPIKGWCFEVNKFAFMQMEDGSVRGIDFQNGRLKNYDSANDFVYERQSGRCYCCGGPIEHYHHIKPRSEGGSDNVDNKIGLCKACHSKVHTGEITLDVAGYYKKYGAVSVLNQAIPYIYEGLAERFGEENVLICSGRDTKYIRDDAALEKDHDIDAVCIASLATGAPPEDPECERFSVKQFRRHDRAKTKAQTERTYELDGEIVAKNRKPRSEQQSLALSQWYEKQVELFGKREADQMLSRLTVMRSCRRYNNTDRIMPGTLVRYMPKGKSKLPSGQIFAVTSQRTGGEYYVRNGKNIPARDCIVLQSNIGLVYM